MLKEISAIKWVNQKFELVAFCSTSVFNNVHRFTEPMRNEYRNGIQIVFKFMKLFKETFWFCFRYIADFSVANGCKLFVEQYGNQIIEKNLTRNFIVHLNNLLEFQVIPQSSITKAVDILFKMKANLSGKKMWQLKMLLLFLFIEVPCSHSERKCRSFKINITLQKFRLLEKGCVSCMLQNDHQWFKIQCELKFAKNK